MKLPFAQIENYASNFAIDCPAILVYGPDAGLVSARAEAIINRVVDKKDPFASSEISTARLKEDAALLTDEMAAISFSGGRRLIRLRDGMDGVTAPLKKALENIPPGREQDFAFLLVTAGELSPRSSLRRFFEGHKKAAALPCYVDDARNLSAIVVKKLKEAGFQFERDVVSHIAQNCQGDRLIVLSEIEKLSLYMGEERQISLADAERCIGETTESSIQDLCNAVAGKDYKGLERHLGKALRQGIIPVIILRSVANYFLRIYALCGHMDEGRSLESAVEGIKPPIFFKQKPLLKGHIQKWRRNIISLERALSILRAAELECKKTGTNAELMCSRFLMMVAAIKS